MTSTSRSQPEITRICQADADYPDSDLETLAGLPRYHDWIVEQFGHHLRGRVAEVGAGLGTVAERLLPHAEALDLIEPSANLVERLRAKFAGRDRVRIIPESVEAWLGSGISRRYDAIVMVNVLEHIEDDGRALDGLREALAPGGKLIVFVPALPFLYSKLDRVSGHYRRYTRRGLVSRARGAGLGVVAARYMDFVGILPWWLMNTVMGKTALNPTAVRIYDTLFVPFSRIAEKMVPPPVGKNVLLIAERPMDGS